MATVVTYRLQPRAAFHFGEQGRELEGSNVTLASDSLFAAFVATLAEERADAEVKAFLEPFIGGMPPFRLTSVFPAVGRLPLLPLPQVRLNPAPQDAPPRKFSKKVQFVSPMLFSALAAGAPLGDAMGGKGAFFLQDGKIWIADSELSALPAEWYTIRERHGLTSADARARQSAMLTARLVWHQGTVPRVTVDRERNLSDVYQMGRVTFADEAGLWFGVAYEDLAWQPIVESVLHSLTDRGLGGERSNGYGAFALDGGVDLPPDWLQTPTGTRQILLARCYPRRDEVDVLRNARSTYALVTVGGWLHSAQHVGLRRKRVTLLTEGSVLATPMQGGLADVTPDWQGFPHRVYRYGYALGVAAVGA